MGLTIKVQMPHRGEDNLTPRQYIELYHPDEVNRLTWFEPIQTLALIRRLV